MRIYGVDSPGRGNKYFAIIITLLLVGAFSVFLYFSPESQAQIVSWLRMHVLDPIGWG